MATMCEQHRSWCRGLQEAIQADAWGQVLEAVEAYERLAEVLLQALPRCHELTAEQRRVIEKTASSTQLRAKILSSLDGQRDSLTKDDMEHILDVLREVLVEEHPAFPVALSEGKPQTAAPFVPVVETDENDILDGYAECSTSKTVLNRKAGASYYDIQIFRVGLKDAVAYVNPTIIVSVYDRDGRRMEEPKETAVGRCEESQYISFQSSTIHLETTVEQMEECGAAVFFEIYHFKTKKRKKSCRCWSIVELDEIGSDAKEVVALALELYQKPIDPKRKRIHLFTAKDLYLHIGIQVAIA